MLNELSKVSGELQHLACVKMKRQSLAAEKWRLAFRVQSSSWRIKGALEQSAGTFYYLNTGITASFNISTTGQTVSLPAEQWQWWILRESTDALIRLDKSLAQWSLGQHLLQTTLVWWLMGLFIKTSSDVNRIATLYVSFWKQWRCLHFAAHTVHIPVSWGSWRPLPETKQCSQMDFSPINHFPALMSRCISDQTRPVFLLHQQTNPPVLKHQNGSLWRVCSWYTSPPDSFIWAVDISPASWSRSGLT